MQTFDDFLLKIKDLKNNYVSGQLKTPAPAVFNLIMSGAMDSLLGENISVEERLEAIEKFKKASKSSAQLPSSKTEALGMDKIKDEFTRKIWLSGVNPLYSFKVCDYYKDALEFIGFRPTGTEHLRFRKEATGFSNPIDIFGTFGSLFLDKTLRIYGNRNTTRRAAIVGIYQGYETKTWGEGNKFIKVKISDGTTNEQATVWPKRNTENQFELKMTETLKMKKGEACIFIGKVGVNKKGYKFFTLSDIIPLA